jgi:hypothetical protein
MEIVIPHPRHATPRHATQRISHRGGVENPASWQQFESTLHPGRTLARRLVYAAFARRYPDEVAGIAVLPIAAWEFSLGLYLIFGGFILRPHRPVRTMPPDSSMFLLIDMVHQDRPGT